MANFKGYCFVFINIVVTCSAISAFSDVLDNSDTCEQKCTKSYAPHTYPNGDENSACARGCRLYSITKFISSDEPKQITNDIKEDDERSPALVLCNRSCIEAYNETSALKNSCQVGCGKQEAISMEIEKTEKENESKMSGIDLMKPIMQVREVTSRVIGMLRIVQTSLTTYFMGENNEMVAVEGPVQVMIQVHRPEPATDDAESETPIERFVKDENSFADSFNTNSVLKVPVEESNSLSAFYNKRNQIDFVIMSGILLTVIFFIYIMISRHSFFTKKSNKMNVSTTIPTHALPVKLVRPEDLTKLSLMDEEEATELPIKFKLPDNTV